MPNEIILPLRAKHFKETVFCSYNGQCAIEKAVQELMPDAKGIGEGVDCTDIDDVRYKHEEYDCDDFDADLILARAANFDDTIIRSITLSPAL